ncbi:Up-regulated during septation domain-containing protein [Trichoderma evansii]
MVSSTPLAATPDEKSTSKKMQQDGQGKYQLFPKGRQSPCFNNSTSVDPETAFALAMNKTSDRNDRSGATTPTLKVKANQNQPIVRRRKATIPDLGPMTTVQEIAMDSPTIPGRPPLRERSISAPEDGPKQDMVLPHVYTLTQGRAIYAPPKQIEVKRRPKNSNPPRLPSPKRLAPLVIPEPDTQSFVREVQRSASYTHLRADSTPPMSTGVRQYLSPLSSKSDNSDHLASGSTDATSATTLPTPASAPIMEKKPVIKQWEPRCRTPLSATRAEESSHSHGHRRIASESQSIMHRGRPRKRAESHKKSDSHSQPSCSEKKRSKSAEQRAFEELPQGVRPLKAATQMSANDLAILRQQALGQAERFEVLQVEDVESLSKELHRLDERAEYLRRTYNSLRAGRRDLHSRICQYLRSPNRAARFSPEPLLRQEEALAELDASIDDWVHKLERAENRRTRVRQKLLEHIAAAAMLSVGRETPSPVQLPVIQDIATPPRSPVKTTFTSRPDSASPPPLRVVAQVPSMILELPAVEEAEEEDKDKDGLARKSTVKSSAGESIRIYAGDELFALLTDVEDEIYKMNKAMPEEPDVDQATSLLQPGHEQQRSHLRRSAQPDSPTLAPSPMLQFFNPAISKFSAMSTVPPSPPAPVPPLKDLPPREPEVFLTSAVFKPK